MGLDTSHDAWNGSYGSFHTFRTHIAQLAGFPPLKEMKGFQDFQNETLGTRSWTDAGLWPLSDRRLIPLLSHSDCDGELSVEECKGIAAALEQILPEAEKGRKELGPDGWVTKKIKQFIKGCKDAVAANEPIEFH